MILAELSLGAPRWLGWAAGLAALLFLILAWSYWRSASATWVRVSAALLKAAGVAALAVCLVEPLFSGVRPRPGSNLFLILADNSRSLQLADRGSGQTRGQILQSRLAEKSPWLTRLAQDFDVRCYAFDTGLRPVRDFTELTLDGQSSAMTSSLKSLADRFRGRAVAGVLLLSDGNSTDLEDQPIDWKKLPPVYPVTLGSESGLVDLAVTRVSVSQTNFEAAPVTIAAEVEGRGVAGSTVVVRVLDEEQKEVERRSVEKFVGGEPLAMRFLLRPERPGVSFFTVQASLGGEEHLDGPPPGRTAEATLANNRRIATVDRGGGPYRVLYVSGRPNWEFKFLRRAIQGDDEVQLVGLVRVAKKEPKFTFLGRDGERTNPLFRGFDDQKDEEAQQYDQPVLIRLGTENKQELAGGFPRSAEELFAYQAVILDDIEAEFFTQDQQSLLQQFISRRGGGFLMLGGKESFVTGGYQRTPIGEFLPVYLDRAAESAGGSFRLRLTREGWLQPWIRIRTTEQDEEQRLAAMPAFKVVNPVTAIKPGASVLAQIESSDGTLRPALVVQQFGRGRAAALLVADLWRWGLRRADPAENDLDKAWRQTIRWLVSDVPKAVEVETRRLPDDPALGVQIVVRTRDKQFEPLDNAGVVVRVQTPAPDKRQIELTAESSDRTAGEYLATFIPRTPGAYRAQVVVNAADGSEVGRRDTGWTAEPETEEFRTLQPDRTGLERIAKETGGEVLELRGLEAFVSTLPNRKIPVVEAWSYPLWHQWPMFLFAIACLVGEWGLRRWRGLP